MVVSLASPVLHRANGVVYRRFGEPATHTDRLAVATPCTVLVERDLSQYGEVAVVNKRTAVVQVRTTELAGAPRSGDTFTLAGNGQVLVVDSLQGSDEFEHRAFAA